MPEDIARKLVVRTKSRIGDPIIVNSFGRSGSTVLYTSVRDSALRPVFRGRRQDHGIGGQAWKMEGLRLERGRVYKSHDRPVPRIPGNARMFYVFGEPVTATLSVMKRGYDSQEWFNLHCDHLRVPHCRPDDLIGADALRIEDHLRAWLDSDTTPVAFVRYEAMWDKVDEMSEFAGLPISLPPKRERRTSLDDASPEIVQTYARLSELVDSLPDWFVRS